MLIASLLVSFCHQAPRKSLRSPHPLCSRGLMERGGRPRQALTALPAATTEQVSRPFLSLSLALLHGKAPLRSNQHSSLREGTVPGPWRLTLHCPLCPHFSYEVFIRPGPELQVPSQGLSLRKGRKHGHDSAPAPNGRHHVQPLLWPQSGRSCLGSCPDRGHPV